MDIKKKFNYFEKNKSTVYLDSAATSLRLTDVINAEFEYSSFINSTTHSTHHSLGLSSIELTKRVREKTKKFINAFNEDEISFNAGTTFGLNTIIFGVCSNLEKEDVIVTTEIEHSSVIVPMLECVKRNNLNLDYLHLNKDGTIDTASIKKVVNDKTKFIAFASSSNTISSYNNVKNVIKEIKSINKDIIVLVDCAQSVSHHKIDVKDWNADFIVFSTHKMYGPWGLGVMWGKFNLLEKINPLTYGGGSVYDYDKKDFKLLSSPDKFEAGTPNMVSIYSFEKSLDFFNEITIEKCNKIESDLKNYLIEGIEKNNLNKSFNFFGLDNDGPILLIDPIDVPAHDFVNYLNKKYNIVVRSGSHCAHNAKNFTKIDKPTLRVSLAVYNTKKDIDILIEALNNKNDWINYLI